MKRQLWDTPPALNTCRPNIKGYTHMYHTLDLQLYQSTISKEY
jgi:hypothetical protein